LWLSALACPPTPQTPEDLDRLRPSVSVLFQVHFKHVLRVLAMSAGADELTSPLVSSGLDRQMSLGGSVPTSKCFSVVTFNVFIGPPQGSIELARFRNQAALLREEAADVYCLQEVFSADIVQLLRSELGSEYEFLHGQVGSLRVISKRAVEAGMCLVFAALVKTALRELAAGLLARFVGLSIMACIFCFFCRHVLCSVGW